MEPALNLDALIAKLKTCDINSACDIPFKGMVIPARMSKVIDGDTVKVVILMGDHPLTLKIRLKGVDAPESTKRCASSELEIRAGIRVKEYVVGLLGSASIVFVRLLSIDKYGGRYVGRIYLTQQHAKKEECLSEHLLARRYVKAYDGGKKGQWEESELKKIVG